MRVSTIEKKLFRLEAEFYKKEFLNLEQKVSSFQDLGSIASKIECGPFGSNLLDTEYIENGIPVVRPFNLKNATVEDENLVYISEETVKANNLKIYNKGALLFSRVGDIKVGYLNRDFATISPNIIAVVFDNPKLSQFLSLYFQTKYGFKQISRQLKISAQPTISTEIIKDLKIPSFHLSFYEKIKELVNIAHQKSDNSKTLYTQAENLLISELGLENFNPSNEKISIKTLKESFLKTGRLDSEYYQSKYDDYLKKVFSYSNGYELLGECCNIKDKNFMPKDEEEYRYIELANVRNNAQILDCDVLLGKELPTRARRKVNTGDVIVSSIEGSLESCALITEEYNNSLCSTGFYVVNSEKMNSESLLTVFKSSLMLNLMKKGCSGTILTNIVKEEFEKLPIPLLKQGVQDEIASYIKQSLEYSKKAKELLEISIKSVEIAIDKDETVAHNFLEQNRTEQTLIAYYNEQASYYINLAIFRLYEEIGLFDNPKSINYTVKNLRDTFGSSGRLDSEYYQEKYDRLFEKLSDNNCDKLSNLVTIKKSIEPGSESYQTKGTPFIRVQDLTKFGLTDTSIYLSENEFKDCIRPKKDTILLSKDGTVGIAYKMNKAEDIITSSAILHLDIKDKRVLPDYLALVLNSVAVKMQAEKDAGGSIINHWKKSEIENVIIPIIAKEKQEKISKLLIESESLRRESKALLEKAIKLVEMAIECGEEKATAYLNS